MVLVYNDKYVPVLKFYSLKFILYTVLIYNCDDYYTYIEAGHFAFSNIFMFFSNIIRAVQCNKNFKSFSNYCH